MAVCRVNSISWKLRPLALAACLSFLMTSPRFTNLVYSH